MMKQLSFVVSFVCLCTTYAQAQDTSDLTDVHFYPPSAVSMMKYIDYPVSHRTGIPDVSIPLYTLRSGKLELPIIWMTLHEPINRLEVLVPAGL